MTLAHRFVLLALATAAGTGCGGRPSIWSTPIGQPAMTFGLGTAVAVVDPAANRVVLLRPGNDQSLTLESISVGHDFVNAVVSPDNAKLLVVSAGHRATFGDDQPNEAPSLTVIEPAATPTSRRYDFDALSSPLPGLAVDPIENRWVVLYAGSDDRSQAFVQNPNELMLVDLTQPPQTAMPIDYTLHSVGGQPVRFDFTPPLNISGFAAPQRLLVVETDQDLGILRIDDPTNSETSVPLTSSTDTRRLAPAGITVDPGDSTLGGARIGVRVANDSTVITLDLAANAPRSGLAITPNLADVGGAPSQIAFVHANAATLRLVALVPSTGKAVLIDPATSLTTAIALPAAYQRLSLVPSSPASGAGSATASPHADVALLWNGLKPKDGAAFWNLGAAVDQPYASVQTIGVEAPVADVLDVPAGQNNTGMLKVLATASASSFYVLDLGSRTAAPLVTSTSQIALTVSPVGDCVWTFVPGGTNVAATDFGTKHPHALLMERPVHQVYEVSRGVGLDPAAIILHDVGGLGATVYDAATLDDQTRRLYSGLLLGGSTP